VRGRLAHRVVKPDARATRREARLVKATSVVANNRSMVPRSDELRREYQ
jgi:hypothetical protein